MDSCQPAMCQLPAGFTQIDPFMFVSLLYISNIHPGRLTWNIQITHLERKLIFQTSMIMFHVNLQGVYCPGDVFSIKAYIINIILCISCIMSLFGYFKGSCHIEQICQRDDLAIPIGVIPAIPPRGAWIIGNLPKDKSHVLVSRPIR